MMDDGSSGKVIWFGDWERDWRLNYKFADIEVTAIGMW